MDVENGHGTAPEAPGGSGPQERSGAGDADLVARTLAGEAAAFDRLVEAYERRAFAVAYRLLGNADDALDACQEAFLRGYRALATLQEPARFGPWLLRIVGNQSLNFRRSRRHGSPVPLDEELLTGAEETGPKAAARPEEHALAGELHEVITQAMEKLPENQRLALTLFSMNGMSQKEVAEILGCTVEAVKWYVFQGRKTLKGKLKEYL